MLLPCEFHRIEIHMGADKVSIKLETGMRGFERMFDRNSIMAFPDVIVNRSNYETFQARETHAVLVVLILLREGSTWLLSEVQSQLYAVLSNGNIGMTHLPPK